MDPIQKKSTVPKSENTAEISAVPNETPRPERDGALTVSGGGESTPMGGAATVSGPTLAEPSSATAISDFLPAVKRLAAALSATPDNQTSPEMKYLMSQLAIARDFAASEAIMQDYVSTLESRIAEFQIDFGNAAREVSALQKALALLEEEYDAAKTILDNFPKGDPQALARVLAEAEAKDQARHEALIRLTDAKAAQASVEANLRTAELRLAEVTTAIRNPATPEGISLGFWLRLAALAVGESAIRGAQLGDLMDGVTAGRLPADSIAQIAGPDAAAAANVAGDFLANASLDTLNPVGLIELLRTGEWRPPADSEILRTMPAGWQFDFSIMQPAELIETLEQLRSVLGEAGELQSGLSGSRPV